MEWMLIVLLTVALVAIAFAGMAIQVLIKKGGKFPNTHVGGNSYLKRQGIPCAKTQDKIEQAKLKRKVDYTNIRFVGADKSKAPG